MFLFLLFHFLMPEMCENKLFDEKSNFQNNYKAILFVRNCGASTGFSKQLSIIEFDDKLNNDTGNIFISDNNHGNAKSDSFGPIIEINWIDNKTLKVSYSKNIRVFKKEFIFKNIKIIYEESK